MAQLPQIDSLLKNPKISSSSTSTRVPTRTFLADRSFLRTRCRKPGFFASLRMTQGKEHRFAEILRLQQLPLRMTQAGASPCTHSRISRLRCRRENELAAQHFPNRREAPHLRLHFCVNTGEA